MKTWSLSLFSLSGYQIAFQKNIGLNWGGCFWSPDEYNFLCVKILLKYLTHLLLFRRKTASSGGTSCFRLESAGAEVQRHVPASSDGAAKGGDVLGLSGGTRAPQCWDAAALCQQPSPELFRAVGCCVMWLFFSSWHCASRGAVNILPTTVPLKRMVCALEVTGNQSRRAGCFRCLAYRRTLLVKRLRFECRGLVCFYQLI